MPASSRRDQFDQRLLHWPDAPAERAAHLAGGLARLGERLRSDQVAHRLGLGEIESAGQKGALRKLARLGQSRAQGKSAAQQQLQHHRRAVRRYLNEIFGGIRVRSAKKGDHRLVNASSIDEAFVTFLALRSRILPKTSSRSRRTARR